MLERKTAEDAQPGDYVCGELIEAISDEYPDCVWKNAETPFAKNH